MTCCDGIVVEDLVLRLCVLLLYLFHIYLLSLPRNQHNLLSHLPFVSVRPFPIVSCLPLPKVLCKDDILLLIILSCIEKNSLVDKNEQVF